MIALIWNLSFGEVLVVGALAIMIFGGRLPEVAARLIHGLRRFRRGLEDLKRETGIEGELRKFEYEIRDAERAAKAQVSPSAVTKSEPTVEPPPGFRQARRVQGISPDLSQEEAPLLKDKPELTDPESVPSDPDPRAPETEQDSPELEQAESADSEQVAPEKTAGSSQGGDPETSD